MGGLSYRLSECVSINEQGGHLTLRVDGFVGVGQLVEVVTERSGGGE